jgi:hypothetical protein
MVSSGSIARITEMQMKTMLKSSAVLALLAVPATADAAVYCFTNSFGQFFRLSVNGSACTPGVTALGAVHGRWHPGFACNGENTWNIADGACFRDVATGETRVNLVAPLLDPGFSCIPVMWSMKGSAVNNATGVFSNSPFPSSSAGDTWVPASCASEPTPLSPAVAAPNAEGAPGLRVQK